MDTHDRYKRVIEMLESIGYQKVHPSGTTWARSELDHLVKVGATRHEITVMVRESEDKTLDVHRIISDETLDELGAFLALWGVR